MGSEEGERRRSTMMRFINWTPAEVKDPRKRGRGKLPEAAVAAFLGSCQKQRWLLFSFVANSIQI